MSTAHKRQNVNCYSGCPSAAELSHIWSFLLDSPSVGDSACEQGVNSMSISDAKQRDCGGPQETNSSKGVSFAAEASNLSNVDLDKEAVWMESSTPLYSKMRDANLLAGSTRSAMRKVIILPQQIPLAVSEFTFLSPTCIPSIFFVVFMCSFYCGGVLLLLIH